jgi:hypothetical protein
MTMFLLWYYVAKKFDVKIHGGVSAPTCTSLRAPVLFAQQNSVTCNMPIQIGEADEQITVAVAFAEESVN